MVELIKKLLSDNKEISAWKINTKETEADEMFYVGKTLNMNRAKRVTHIMLTVYKDFEADGIKYRGSYTTEIHPTMKENEIKDIIDNAVFAAGFVKNKYYPLAARYDVKPEVHDSSFKSRPLVEFTPLITDAIFKADNYENGKVNSAELFLNKVNNKIINSEGVDVQFSGYNGFMEFVTNCRGKKEEIELYKNMSFSDFKPDKITVSVDKMINLCKEKAEAKPTPALKKGTVLLTGESVKELLSYYVVQASASSVYKNISTLKIGENVQGENIKGDRINMKLDPKLSDSTFSAPYDSDGFPLSEVSVYEDGVLKRYWGDVEYSYYLNVEPTGNIENVVVGCGSKSEEEMKKEPYLELIAFSDFQMDGFTGDFAGEIRLGWYYDGTTRTPVTGGSISGNIKLLHNNMYLSKEDQQINNFAGPNTIQLFDVSITGV